VEVQGGNSRKRTIKDYQRGGPKGDSGKLGSDWLDVVRVGNVQRWGCLRKGRCRQHECTGRLWGGTRLV